MVYSVPSLALLALLIPITGLGRKTAIVASINAGGLGAILFDGLRTMNTAKILWGSLLSAVLAVGIDRLLILVEQRSEKRV